MEERQDRTGQGERQRGIEGAPVSIAAFLLARIDEDEENAGRYVEVFPDGDVAPLFRRVLAECAAKRAIIAAHESYAKSAPDLTGIAAVGARCGQEVTLDALRTLASVYSDHPDYQQRWAA